MTQQPALLVDCHKIINWLQQRRKLPKQWYNYQKAASQKIKFLLKDPQQYSDTDTQSIVQYIKENAQNFTYMNVLQIFNMLLKTRWAQQKNLIFGYSDPRVKQWQNIKKFMENKQVAIVNIAKYINQGLSFELPSMDKNIELLDSQIANLKRKIDFNTNTVYHQQKQSSAQKVKLGLKSINDKGESITVTEQIPRLIIQVPDLINKLQDKIYELHKFYNLYIKFCEKDGIDVGDGSSMELRVLRKFIFSGNAYAKDISNPDTQPQRQQHRQQVNKQKYISFYQWKPHNQWGIEIQQPNTSSQTNQKQQNQETILQYRPLRIELLQDLNQLLFFYYGLRNQKVKSSNVNTSVQLQDDLTANLLQSDMDTVIRELQQCLKTINTTILPRIQLKTTPKAYQILLKKFRNYQQNIQQMHRQNTQYQKQIEEMAIRRESTVKDMMNLRARLVENKNQCERLLSEFMKRQIRITGEINKYQ